MARQKANSVWLDGDHARVGSHPERGLRQIVATRCLPEPRFHYSPVVRTEAGVFVSGLVGLDPGTGTLVQGTHAQTRQILSNLFALCHEQGWSRECIAMARLFCIPAAQQADMHRAWEEAFADIAPPARSFVVAHSLPLGADVEIEFQLAP